MQKRLDEFQELRAKAKLYSELLSMKAEDINENITKLEKEAKAIICNKVKPELSVEEILAKLG
jgi:hypothetical protein